MASPFRYFRKHTKAFMAVAAVLCMFIFVFASGLGGGGGGGRGDRRAASAMVATWDGGSINEGELDNLVRARLVTDQFLQMLLVQGGATSAYDIPANLPNFLLRSQQPDIVQMEVIRDEVFASLAEDAGMSVSDELINNYMLQWGQNRVTGEDVIGLLGAAGPGSMAANEAAVFGTLRTLLLAYFYRSAYQEASAVLLPEQRWEYWRRVNERISLQVAKLPVEDFLGDVPQPSDAELKALYEQYRDVPPNQFVQVLGRELPVPTPGFAEPRRVVVEYVLGSVTQRTVQYLASITEEEIVDYYERNKRQLFVRTDLQGFEGFEGDEFEGFDELELDLPVEGEMDMDGAESESAADDDGAVDGTGDVEAAGAAPADDEGPGDIESSRADESESVEETSAAESAEDVADGGDDGDGSDAATDDGVGDGGHDAADDGDDADSQPQSADRRRQSPFRLAALQLASEEEEEASDEESARSDAATGDLTEGDDAADDANLELGTTGTDSVDVIVDEQDLADDADGEATAESAEDADAGSSDEGAAEEEVEFVPLDEVRDEIRETLARDKAVQELETIMQQAAAVANSEYTQYGRQVVVNREAERAPPAVPERLTSFDWLAEQYNLIAEHTEPLTARELFETAVGKADNDQMGVNVAQAVLGRLKLHEPFLAQDLNGDWYLVMKTADELQRTPEFDEVRDRVTAAWKRIEAAKLAEDRAQELAEEVDQSNESFTQFFGDLGYEVVAQTALFSWRSYVGSPGMGSPMLSDVPELANVGNDFMETAFSLEGDETAAAMSYDRSAAYVIRLFSRQYTPAELHELFLRENPSWPGQLDMRRETIAQFDQAVTPRMFEDLANFRFDPEWERRRQEQLENRGI